MDKLPDELIVHILSFLDAIDLTRTQLLARRYLRLARDKALWKLLCFDSSQAELTRRRLQMLETFSGRLEELRLALTDFTDEDERALERALGWQSRSTMRRLAFANWDPAYPGEHADFYEDYINRHATISTNWLPVPRVGGSHSADKQEVTGITLLQTEAMQYHALSALDDGSILIHDLQAQSPSFVVAGHSGPGLLTPGVTDSAARSALMTASGATDSVSTCTHGNRAYFAVQDALHEIDLSSLSLVSSKRYPYAITALSSLVESKPLIVGTNQTVHIYDSRDAHEVPPDPQHDARVELISGSPAASQTYISLSQPGPLSILHAPDSSDSIWITGRFTSLLQHSLRFFPRLLSTTHSGARISCLTAIPYPFVPAIPPDLSSDQSALYAQRINDRATLGWTAVCAGEYKGKGSLELFGMSGIQGMYTGRSYLNRQTAGRSKLLAVAAQGARLVHSDGDGNLKWTERNGTSFVRNYNINQQEPKPSLEASQREEQETAPRGLFGSNAEGDIVQKIMPFSTTSALTQHAAQKMLLWTGEGRLGVLGFGPSDPLLADEWHDAVETHVESTADKAKRDAEMQYSLAMRRALERNADEVRFVRGLGMAGPM